MCAQFFVGSVCLVSDVYVMEIVKTFFNNLEHHVTFIGAMDILNCYRESPKLAALG